MLSFVGKSFLPEQVANTMTSNPMMTYGTLFGMNIAAGKLINTGVTQGSWVMLQVAYPHAYADILMHTHARAPSAHVHARCMLSGVKSVTTGTKGRV